MVSSPVLFDFLPSWVGYTRVILASVMAFGVSFVCMWGAARLITPRRIRLRAMHWSERARMVHPSAIVLGMGMGFLPIFFGSWCGREAGAANTLPVHGVGALAVAFALAGWSLASWRMRRHALDDGVGWLDHARGQLVMVVFVMPGLVIMFFMMATVRGALEPKDIACASIGAISLVLSSIYSGLPVARLLGVVHPASPRLAALVDQVASELGRRPSVVEEMNVPLWNAFALPLGNRLVFTRAAVEGLDDDALRGVIAHEIGHLGERTRMGWLRALPGLGYFTIGMFPVIGTHAGGLAVWLAWGAAMLCMWAPLAWVRRGEEKADAVAHSIDGDDTHYARALEMIHQRNLSPAVSSRFQTHPSLYDRMLAAGVEPGFPRPGRPSVVRVAAGTLIALVLMAVLLVAIPVAMKQAIRRAPDAEAAMVLQIAFFGPTPSRVFSMARARMDSGDDGAAMVFVEAALSEAPDHHAYNAVRSILLAREGRCDDATEGLDHAWDMADEAHSAECRWLSQASSELETCASSSPESLASTRPAS